MNRGWSIEQANNNLRKEQMQGSMKSSKPNHNEESAVKRPVTGAMPKAGSTSAKHIVHEATSRSQDSGKPSAGTLTHLAK